MPVSHVRQASSQSDGTSTKKAQNVRESGPDLLRGLLLLVMAMDHLVFSLHPGQHGTSRHTEYDSLPVLAWNHPAVYILRTATHLCAPGFTFLLGMGVVYLGRARRRKIGWSNRQLLRHFAVRALILAAISIVWGLLITLGQVWFFNLILFALAVDYLLAGVLWITINALEETLATWFEKVWLSRPHAMGDDDTTPLLASRPGLDTMDRKTRRAKSISWHILNVFLLVLSVITIWWNVWLSDTNGHCNSADSSVILPYITETSEIPMFLRIWLWVTKEGRVDSRFPPMAWLTYAILGLLYGRILIHKRRPSYVTALGLAAASLVFLLLFVSTRLFHFGNLSEGCLRTPDQAAHPGANQYLASARSFFYIIKYNPDVAFWAFTMSVNLALLAIFTAVPTSIASSLAFLHDFGSAPLFFFQVHQLIRFPFIEVFVYLLGYEKSPSDPVGNDYIWGTLIWFCGMVIMWPLCRWYGRFKGTKPSDSIWRFF